jgi:glycosyltransferase involved in cell wall biosynthesis
MYEKKIWITWEYQRRNKSLSAEIGASLYEIVIGGSRIKRYILSIIETIKVILSEKPTIVFVQNPSIVLALLSLLLKKIFKFKLIVDEHNAGIFPQEGRSRFLNKLAKIIAVNANYAIVTNKQLENILQKWGANPLVLPDPLPNFEHGKIFCRAKTDFFKVLFICTWSDDEPVLSVLEAAKKINKKIKISITGRHEKYGKIKKVPNNVTLTGFLNDEDFVSELKQSDAVLVLTERENCLNCGAYEAIAAEKPLILSDTLALRKYFDRGVVFTVNDPDSIAQSLDYVYLKNEEIKKEIEILKKELLLRWVKMKSRFDRVLLGM